MNKNIKNFKIGDHLLAKQMHSWTLDEFDDYPLVVYPNDRGVVVDIDYKQELIYVKWEKDEFSRMKKAMSFAEANNLEIIQ